MTKELSLICIFFVLFCLNIYSSWDNLSLVNPMLPFKQGLFFWECFVQGYIIITPAPVQAGRRENYASCGKLLSSEYNVDRHHKSYAHLLWAGIRHTRLRALASKIETDPADDNSLTPPRCPEQPSAPAPVGLLAVPENVRGWGSPPPAPAPAGSGLDLSGEQAVGRLQSDQPHPPTNHSNHRRV
jgi:hypothetical protein